MDTATLQIVLTDDPNNAPPPPKTQLGGAGPAPTPGAPPVPPAPGTQTLKDLVAQLLAAIGAPGKPAPPAGGGTSGAPASGGQGRAAPPVAAPPPLPSARQAAATLPGLPAPSGGGSRAADPEALLSIRDMVGGILLRTTRLVEIGEGGASGGGGAREEKDKEGPGIFGKLRDFVGGTFRTSVGAVQQAIAGDNVGGAGNALGKAANATAETLGKIPVAGAVLETSIKGIVEVMGSAVDTTKMFVERGKELAQYNPQLAMANAQGEIRTLLGDIREAQELGPALAELTDAQADANAELRELLLPMKKWLIEVLAGIMETIADWIHGTRAFFTVEFWQTMMSEWGEALKPWADKTFAEANANIGRKFDELKDALSKTKPEANLAEDQIRRLMRQTFMPGVNPGAVGLAAGAGQAAPIVMP